MWTHHLSFSGLGTKAPHGSLPFVTRSYYSYFSHHMNCTAIAKWIYIFPRRQGPFPYRISREKRISIGITSELCAVNSSLYSVHKEETIDGSVIQYHSATQQYDCFANPTGSHTYRRHICQAMTILCN